MRILLIRHGDPDYVNDTLTQKGHREAALLAEAADFLEVGDCYQSPLGRAKAAAKIGERGGDSGLASGISVKGRCKPVG